MKTIKHIHQDAYGRWVITLNNHEEVVHANLQKANELASRICAGTERMLVGRSVTPSLLRTQA